jgi:hypothetical protein
MESEKEEARDDFAALKWLPGVMLEWMGATCLVLAAGVAAQAPGEGWRSELRQYKD